MDTATLLEIREAATEARIKRVAPYSVLPVTQFDRVNGTTELWLHAQGRGDYVVPAFGIVNAGKVAMIVGTKEGAIYVTREQAKAFFDLVEREDEPCNG